jgi:hypothetical protein
MPGVTAAERIHEWIARHGDKALAGRGWKAYIPSLIL